jgi:nitrogen permease regulator 3-like protein
MRSFTGEHHRDPDFDWVLGYKTKLLAEHVFHFDRNLCNQRFELILEELLFLAHPVCIGDDGTWQWEQLYSDPKQKKEERGGDRSAVGSDPVLADPQNEASLKSFHFILVLDRPDPPLGGNANLTRFVDVYYEQLAIKMTAALHYEQSRDGYVERETDLLVDLMENCERFGLGYFMSVSSC